MTGAAQGEGRGGEGTTAALATWGAARPADLRHALDAPGGAYLAGVAAVAAFLKRGGRKRREGGREECVSYVGIR